MESLNSARQLPQISKNWESGRNVTLSAWDEGLFFEDTL